MSRNEIQWRVVGFTPDAVTEKGMAVESCISREIKRVNNLSEKEFHDEYFLAAKPVIITDATENWPARSWTIPDLVNRYSFKKLHTNLQGMNECLVILLFAELVIMRSGLEAKLIKRIIELAKRIPSGGTHLQNTVLTC